jgi:hypothetical protein
VRSVFKPGRPSHYKTNLNPGLQVSFQWLRPQCAGQTGQIVGGLNGFQELPGFNEPVTDFQFFRDIRMARSFQKLAEIIRVPAQERPVDFLLGREPGGVPAAGQQIVAGG